MTEELAEALQEIELEAAEAEWQNDIAGEEDEHAIKSNVARTHV